MFKSFLISCVSFAILDFLWLGVVMKKFNLEQLSEIGRIQSGEFQVMYGPALAVYVLMAVALTFFVLPRISVESPWSSGLVWGAIMGLLIYGVYDMTNLAILKNYPVPFACADVAWGTFSFAVVTVLTNYFNTATKIS
jgi:uncharacterized membrane protein